LPPAWKRTCRWIAAFTGVFLLAIVTSSMWLPLAGSALCVSDPPVKADAAVVLAGDFTGERVRKAAALAKAGYVPKVLVSGPNTLFGKSWCGVIIPYAVSQGYQRDMFDCIANNALSTRTEARAIFPELKKRHIHSFILVTSDTHTRRAAFVFRQEGEVPFHTVSAPSEDFRLATWWKSREGRKAVFLEWVKSFNERIGL
jgi:uncharacterized SAM-binding protein YcdF (DUF218 family)